MIACRYEISLLMCKLTSRSFAALILELSSYTCIEKFHIYAHPCIVLCFTQYSFFVMESRVSSTCNIHRPSMPEKEAIDLKVYACSNIHLGEVLFHYVMFCDKKK